MIRLVDFSPKSLHLHQNRTLSLLTIIVLGVKTEFYLIPVCLKSISL